MKSRKDGFTIRMCNGDYIQYYYPDTNDKLVCLGVVEGNIVKVREKSILYRLGLTSTGLPIEINLPKSNSYIKDNKYLYVPLWLAKQKGIGWYLQSEENYISDFHSLDTLNNFVSGTKSEEISKYEYNSNF